MARLRNGWQSSLHDVGEELDSTPQQPWRACVHTCMCLYITMSCIAYMNAFIHHNVMHCIHACIYTSQCHAYTCIIIWVPFHGKRGVVGRDKQLLGPDIKCMQSEITAHLYVVYWYLAQNNDYIHVAMILQLLTLLVFLNNINPLLS